MRRGRRGSLTGRRARSAATFAAVIIIILFLLAASHRSDRSAGPARYCKHDPEPSKQLEAVATGRSRDAIDFVFVGGRHRTNGQKGPAGVETHIFCCSTTIEEPKRIIAALLSGISTISGRRYSLDPSRLSNESHIWIESQSKQKKREQTANNNKRTTHRFFFSNIL
jgi:hypothetical protein